MFTGIVEEVGRILEVDLLENGRRIRVAAGRVREGLALGDSVAMAGVCQTAVALDDAGFSVVAIGTTLSRTTLGDLVPGREINLERALPLGGRLGGHMVQGHVDGVGEVLAVREEGEHHLIDIRLPEVVAEVTVLHGSLAIDGVSMTVNALPAADVAQIAVIPFTWAHTTLSSLAPGSRVNLEGDLIGKFVVNYLKRTGRTGVGA